MWQHTLIVVYFGCLPLIIGLLKSFRGGEDVPIENKVVTMALDKVKRRLEDQFRDERQQVRVLLYTPM